MENSLWRPVRKFIDDLADDAHRTRSSTSYISIEDIAFEAFCIASAFIDGDKETSDAEVTALIDGFEFQFPEVKGLTADEVRATLTADRHDWARQPSKFFLQLLDMGTPAGDVAVDQYVASAIELAEATARLDSVSNQEEKLLHEFTSMLNDTAASHKNS